jgi:hypothetical protein
MVDLLRITPDADYWYFAWSRIYLGIGLPLIFIPITTASYDRIQRRHSAVEDRSGFCADQPGAKFRRIDGRGAEPDRAGAA